MTRKPWDIIKSSAEKAKQDNANAKAERASLEREEQRILERVKEVTGKDLTTIEDIEAERKLLMDRITEGMQSMAKTLDEVDYLNPSDRETLVEKGIL